MLIFALFLAAASNSLSAAALPLGALTTNSTVDATCPSNFASRGFSVSCPGVSNSIDGFFAVGTNYGKPRGVVVTFTGDDGMTYWTSHGTEVYALGEELRSLGFILVQVRWVTSWLESSPGNDAGTAHLGCRPATVIKYIYDTYYVPLGLPRQKYAGGFVLTGNSGGATQVSYALSHYGLKDILDVVIPTGGPPHAALAKSCMNTAGEQGYWFPLTTRQFIDRGFGHFETNGPAARQDPMFVPRWLEESVAAGGNDYVYPDTRVHFVLGSQDAKMQTIARDYYDRLRSEPTANVMWEVVPNTPHGVHSTAEGRAAIKAAILGSELSTPLLFSNQVQLRVSGSTNLSYVTQVSTNLNTWLSFQTNRGASTFTESNVVESSRRFYRVQQIPSMTAR